MQIVLTIPTSAIMRAGHCRASGQPGQNAGAKKGDFHRLSRLSKSLLVYCPTMRTGRSYSPRTLVSKFIGLYTMPSRRRHVTQRRV